MLSEIINDANEEKEKNLSNYNAKVQKNGMSSIINIVEDKNCNESTKEED